MKILILTSDFYPRIGGGENYILNLAKQFSKQNEVHVLCPNELDSGIKKIFGLTVHYLPYYKAFGNKFIKPSIISKNIKKINPDIIYSSGPSIMDFFAVFLSKKFKKRSFLTYHADLDLNKLSSRIFTKLYFWLCLPQYDKIIVTTKKYQEILKNRGITPKKMSIVPVGFEITNKNRVNIFKDKKAKKLLFVGALDSQHLYKNLSTLIEAMNLLKEEGFELSIVGDGDLRKKYQEQVEKSNLKNIKFLGKLKDKKLIREYKSSEIFILPSNSEKEGFGIVLLESLSLGCKIITGEKSGGAYLINENPKIGKLYSGTKEDLSNKIRSLSHMKLDMKRISSIMDEYLWETISNKIYSEIIKK